MFVVDRFASGFSVAVVFLICVAISGACYGETATFELPFLNWGGTYPFVANLGQPATSVTSVHLHVSGTATSALVWYEELGFPPCSNPRALPQDFSIRFRDLEATPSSYCSAWWEQTEDGSFTFDAEMCRADELDGLFADGEESFVIVSGGHEISEFLFLCEYFELYADCRWCDYGVLEFDARPVVTIEYETAVPADRESWDGVKARYR